MRHRPIGIGVQGLADVFALMDLSFTSEEARDVNKLIFETIYHAAVERSMEIAKERYDLIQLAKKEGKYEDNAVLSLLKSIRISHGTKKLLWCL